MQGDQDCNVNRILYFRYLGQKNPSVRHSNSDWSFYPVHYTERRNNPLKQAEKKKENMTEVHITKKNSLMISTKQTGQSYTTKKCKWNA